MSSRGSAPPLTPDGRYIVVRGRLWRAANPNLTHNVKQSHVDALMSARRAVRDALHDTDPNAIRDARQAVDAAKRALGERGEPWWDDSAPDLNRHMVINTIYAAWWAEHHAHARPSD